MSQYSDGVIDGMQMLYGDGFLSPGGPGEVPDLIGDEDVAGRAVLDIGCGLGGLALMLIRDYGAGHVTAIDIEDELISRARTAVTAAGLGERVAAQRVEPGPLPFPDGSFDLAITKDVVCHIEDKTAVFGEIRRVLKPGGRLLLADFFDNRADSADDAAALFDAYVAGMAAYGLNFQFRPFDAYEEAMAAGGLSLTSHRDHTEASADVARREHNVLNSPDALSIRDALGPDRFAARCAATEMRMRALESRGLLHGHVVAVRPA